MKVGSVNVPVSRCLVRVKGRRYLYHRLRYWLDGRLHRPLYATRDAALAAAEKIGGLLSASQGAWLKIAPADAASLIRARQILSSHNVTKPLELVCSEYCQTLPSANADPRHTTPFPDVVRAFLEYRQQAGKRVRYQQELKCRLGILAGAIQRPLLHLTAAEIAAVLDRLQASHGWTNRSRNHYRAALSNLCTYARREGHYLPREWNEIEYVARFEEHPPAIIVWTPAEVRKLFAVAARKMPRLVPALTLMFFTGQRHSETTGTRADAVPPMQWSDLDLRTGEGALPEQKVRRYGGRITYLPPNAREWLRRYRKRTGPVCPYQNLNNQLAKLMRLARMKWKHNAARRSYISYRLAQTRNAALVSSETGTAIGTIQKYYRAVRVGQEKISLKLALEYFNILPPVRRSRFGGQNVAKTVSAGRAVAAAKPAANP